MAISKDDLVTKLNAEIVGGNYVAGPIGNRVFVGKINEEGVFYITPEGEEMMAALDAPAEVVEEKPKATRKKAAVPVVEDDISAAINAVE
jgi:hypothetical protein